MLLVARILCLLHAGRVVLAWSRGYSLSFQGANAVAGIRKSLINWDDGGMREVGFDVTIMGWFKFASGVIDGCPFLLTGHGVDDIYIDFYAVHAFGVEVPFAVTPPRDESDVHQRQVWHHFAVVFRPGSIRTYLNGSFSNEQAVETNSLRGPNATFMLGSRLKTKVPIIDYAEASGFESLHSPNSRNGFVGEMDDFSIYSSALTESEIAHAMVTPVGEDIPSNLVIHYNFDVHGCEQGRLYHSSCGVTGNLIVKNYGVAGSDYDLTLGQLNNDYGFGKRWKSDIARVEGETWGFGVPQSSLNTPPTYTGQPALDYHIPTVAQVLFMQSTRIQLPTQFAPNKILSLPATVVVQSGSTGANLAVGDDISLESELIIFAGNSLEFVEPLAFNLSLIGGYVHQVHIWPFFKPELVEEQVYFEDGVITLPMIRGQSECLLFKRFYRSKTGEALDLRILKLPPGIRAFWELVVIEMLADASRLQYFHQIQLDKDYLKNENGLALCFHDLLFFGTYQFVVELVSPTTGWSTPPIIVRLQVHFVDMKPNVFPVDEIVLEEDSDGTIITLATSDEENMFGFSATVNMLPTKGDLYKENDVGEWEKITDVYNAYDIGKPFRQFATQVINVSSFILTTSDHSYTPFPVANHPMYVTGPPAGCFSSGRFCSKTMFEHASTVGLHVLVDLYFPTSELANISSPGKVSFALGRVVQDSGALSLDYSRGDTIVDVEILPMFKYVQGVQVPCYFREATRNKTLDSESTVREHCDQTFVPQNRPFVIRNIPWNSPHLKIPQPQAWVPMPRETKNENGGDLSALFGEQYRTNETIVYKNDDLVPPFTDYIEVLFDEPVYPTHMIISSPFGGGAVVRIKVETPDGKWQIVYQGRPQHDKAGPISAPFMFTENICQPYFKTNKFRIELDISEETGIERTIFIDSIILVGARTLQSGVLGFQNKRVKYIPKKDAFGEDKFHFGGTDCGGFSTRLTEDGVMKISITPKEDEPVITTQQDKVIVICNDTAHTSKVVFTGYDVDNDYMQFTLLRAPTHGLLHQGSQRLEEGGEIHHDGKGIATLEYNCSLDALYLGGFDEIGVLLTDGTGQTTNNSVRVKVLKTRTRNNSNTFLLALIGSNVIVSILCIAWLVKYHNAPTLLFGNTEFLLVVTFGSVVSTSSIFPFTRDDGLDGSNKSSADVACAFIPLLYTLGFLITFTAIYTRIHQPRRSSMKMIYLKLSILWVVDIGIICAWLLSAPPHYQRLNLRFDEDIPDFPLETIGHCTADGNPILGILVVHILFLAHVAYCCFKQDEKGKGDKCLHNAVSLSLFVLLFAILVTLSTEEKHPSMIIFLFSSAVWLNSMSIIIFAFAPFIPRGKSSYKIQSTDN